MASATITAARPRASTGSWSATGSAGAPGRSCTRDRSRRCGKRSRRDFVAGELAAGRHPGHALAQLASSSTTKVLSDWAVQYETSRIDYAVETTKNLSSHLKRILPTFGARDPHGILWSEVQTWVADLAREMKPSSIARYMATLRLLLEFAGVDPNPARDKRVKLPTIIVEEPQPPTAKQFLALLDKIPDRWILPLITLEQTAMTVGEAYQLAWGDVDVLGGQFRLRRSTVKGGIRARARWVQLPDVADGRDRGHVPAGGPHRGAEGVPRVHPQRRRERDGARLQGGRDPAVLPARSPSPADHAVAPRRDPCAGARRAGRSCARVDVARRVQPRDAARRGGNGRAPGSSEGVDGRSGVVPVWSPGLTGARKPAFLHDRRFPARNRIVAGLARATVVVEARERSGALITADFALELGRDVFAVPGEITSGLSKGTNDLIRQGATPLLAAGDVFESLGVEPISQREPASGSPEEGAVLDVLADGAGTLDEISRATGLGSPKVAVALTELELAGLVMGGDGLYRVKISAGGRPATLRRIEDLVHDVGENDEAEGGDGEPDADTEADV